MAGIQKLFENGVVLNKAHEQVNLEKHCADKKVGIYFSAHWCPPCRGFTPVLRKFYENHHDNLNLEVIFVSSDQDQESFNQYYSSMPWLALDFSKRDLKSKLCNDFGIRGIPSFIIIDADTGYLVTKDGRDKVEFADENGVDSSFHWN